MKGSKLKQLQIGIVVVGSTLIMACDKTDRSYSIMGTQQQFRQSGETFQQRKIDILWVVDNSGSMQTSQANLVNNFTSFINRFTTLGFDYHMAVTSSDAYLSDPFYNDGHTYYSPNAGRFKQGSTGTYGYGLSGIFVMTPQNTTPDVFKKNISIGTSGSGDERAFSSFKRALEDPINAGYNFRRNDAFLSIIILSDEDDFSGTASNDDHFNSTYALNFVGDHNWNAASPLLRPVDYYVDWLNTYTNSTTRKNYSVSSIHVDSAACKTQLDLGAPSTSRIISRRGPEIAAKTNGQSASLCSNFGDTLSTITNSVLELTSAFKLKDIPMIDTIVVTVDGVVVPMDPSNGWTFESVDNSVTFHGSAVPGQNALINIAYDPQ